MINFLFCTVLPPGASKVDQTHKSYDFLDLTQFFQIWLHHSVLIGINDVRNYVLNNFEIRDQLSRTHSFHSKSLWSWQNSAISQKKISFWSTLQAPSKKTVHLQELVIIFKVVLINIIDIIQFD